MNPYLLLLALIAVIGAFLGGEYRQERIDATAYEARIEKERAEAAESARNKEHQQQEAVNNALWKQIDDMARINDGLSADLERLRNRPQRPTNMPQASRADCQGANGAELSREDAGFLVREAARADRLRSALSACYTAYDAIGEAR